MTRGQYCSSIIASSTYGGESVSLPERDAEIGQNAEEEENRTEGVGDDTHQCKNLGVKGFMEVVGEGWKQRVR